MLRASTRTAVGIVRQHSTAAAAAPKQQHPVVVSRRAWKEWRLKNPKSKSSNDGGGAKKQEDKPWPRSVQIAGYASMIIGVPYSAGWYLSSNRELREAVGMPDAAVEVLRQHFGDPEVQSWHEYLEGDESSVRYKLEDEEPFQVRNQQSIIRALDEEDTVVTMQIPRDGVTMTETKTFSGATPANAKVLLGIDSNINVALDFEDLPSSKNEESSWDDTSLSSSLETFSSSSSNASKQQVYSSWYYQAPPPAEQQQGAAAPKASNTEIEIAKLEYQIEKLQHQIRDITSTMSMDDAKVLLDEIQPKLAKAKSRLSNLKWSRRLGMG